MTVQAKNLLLAVDPPTARTGFRGVDSRQMLRVPVERVCWSPVKRVCARTNSGLENTSALFLEHVLKRPHLRGSRIHFFSSRVNIDLFDERRAFRVLRSELI